MLGLKLNHTIKGALMVFSTGSHRKSLWTVLPFTHCLIRKIGKNNKSSFQIGDSFLYFGLLKSFVLRNDRPIGYLGKRCCSSVNNAMTPLDRHSFFSKEPPIIGAFLLQKTSNMELWVHFVVSLSKPLNSVFIDSKSVSMSWRQNGLTESSATGNVISVPYLA